MTHASSRSEPGHDDALHELLLEKFGEETEAWVGERLDRVMARLNAVRADGVALTAHSLRIPACTAFTTPAPRLYIARVLHERLPSDESVAFVLAHETAHHDLGHLTLFRGIAQHLPRGVAGTIAAEVYRNLSHQLHSPERESQADQYAVELCLDAGYDGARCLQAFEILENESLNRGDIDGVFGPEHLLDPTDPKQGGATYEAQRWLWAHLRRYRPLRERKEAAWSYLTRRLAERATR